MMNLRLKQNEGGKSEISKIRCRIVKTRTKLAGTGVKSSWAIAGQKKTHQSVVAGEDSKNHHD